MVPRLWSSLSKKTKAMYRRKGVTPQRYNAWNKKTPAQKKALKAKGTDRNAFLGLPPRAAVPSRGVVAARATHMLLNDRRPAWAPTILSNVLRMNASQLKRASVATVDEWTTRARQQVSGNVWFYHKP